MRTLTAVLLLVVCGALGQVRRLGRLDEVFAWKQLTYDIGGLVVLQDRFSEVVDSDRRRRSSDSVFFHDNDGDTPDWNINPPRRPTPAPSVTATTVNPNDEVGRFFIQYNNVPMGVERVGNRLFVTVPRRRYGIPATLNYIDLNRHAGDRSPPLSPYPDMSRSRSLISVYRTRADECGRLWMVDTGVIEIPNNPRYLQRPAIVVFDLKTNRQMLRYQLKDSDLPATNTPTGLASITVVLKDGNCNNAFAHIVDVATYGVITYSLRQNDSWRHNHNYFHFNPTAGSLRVAQQSFQWNDGVFSIAPGTPSTCTPLYFHPMVSNQEFVVSSCELEKREANQTAFAVVGDRGPDTQCTMHGYHGPTNVILFADVGRNALSCWNVGMPLNAANVAIVAQDEERLSYPADLHVIGDEVWVMANTLPRFIYSRLDVNNYNFFIYRANIRDLIAGTVCDRRRQFSRRSSDFN